MGRSSWPPEAEISSYVDGEMPVGQRAEMEALAAEDQTLAARLLDDLSLNDALRRASPPRVRHGAETLRLARRLERSLTTRRTVLPLAGRMAAAVAFMAIGWQLNTLSMEARTTPTVADQRFVDSAREALRVAELDSGPGEPIGRKIDRLEAVTDIQMPNLPSNWKVLNVQVQPFNGKPSVVVTAESPILGPVTLVAAPMEQESAVPPTPATDETVPTVYWQSGGTAYALMGTAAPTQLKSVADGIEVATRRKTWTKTRG